jgi:predicted ATPase with chaperone activity
MVQHIATVAFEGVEARPVDVQAQVAPGLPAFNIVGLPDKAVSEAKERVRAALVASGLALPAKRITINLAPADLPKEGSHYDLPIALGLMAAIGAIPPDALANFTVVVSAPRRCGSNQTVASITAHRDHRIDSQRACHRKQAGRDRDEQQHRRRGDV